MNLKDLIINSARLFPDKTAVIHRKKRLTYREFYTRTCACGSAMRSAGVGKGDRVCIAARNCIEYLEIMFGCSMIGAVPCLINWRLSSDALCTMARETEPKLLFISNTDISKAAALTDANQKDAVRVISVCDDPEIPSSYDEFRSGGSAELEFAETKEDDTGMILFTSGTTGRAKGVLISNRALLIQIYNTAVCARWSHEERFMCVSPICHSISLSVITTFCVGGTLILCPLEYLKDYRKILSVLEEERVTRTAMVPTVIERMVSCAEDNGITNSTLRTISYGASPMNASLIERCRRIFNCRFHQGYGMTETYGTITALLPEDHDRPECLGSVGRPMAGACVKILGDNGAELPAGRIGEIVIKAETLMQGYLSMPELTEKVIVNGWYHSGDIGYIGENGYLFLTDRKNSMIITGGENVFPSEIESCILELSPEVREVCVAGLPDPVWGEMVVAAVVKRENSTLTENDIMAHCRERLGSFKKPKRVMFVDTLPVNGSGKVQRETVKEMFQNMNTDKK